VSEDAQDGTRGIAFVVAAPSGTGKTTVCRRAMERDPRLHFSVSHTTRKPRSGERDGVDYHFVTAVEFRRLVEASVFLEYAEFNGNLYGTSWEALETPLAEGSDLIVEIEVQGARQLRTRRPDACFVFLLPPSMETLGERLRARATDSAETIAKRLAIAAHELEAIEHFDYAFINDELDRAVEALLEIIAGRRAGRDDILKQRYGCQGVFERWRAACDASGDGPPA
jgi:guanylate kinase